MLAIATKDGYFVVDTAQETINKPQVATNDDSKFISNEICEQLKGVFSKFDKSVTVKAFRISTRIIIIC